MSSCGETPAHHRMMCVVLSMRDTETPPREAGGISYWPVHSQDLNPSSIFLAQQTAAPPETYTWERTVGGRCARSPTCRRPTVTARARGQTSRTEAPRGHQSVQPSGEGQGSGDGTAIGPSSQAVLLGSLTQAHTALGDTRASTTAGPP